MAINLRRVGEVADGSVTSSKLADGAVDLSSDKVVGQAPSSKIEDGAVVENKLADLAISTQKLKDSVVTLAKASNDIRLRHFVGDETEVSISGNVEEVVKEFNIPKHAAYNINEIRVLASIKTNDESYTTYLKIYVDDETTARVTLTSTSTNYELVAGEADISDLIYRKHHIKISLVSSDALGIAYNDLIDASLII